MSENILLYNYKFILKDGKEKIFSIKLDKNTLALISEKKEEIPDWAKLENHKCTNCPIDSNEEKYCPIAVHIMDMILFFKDMVSFEEVDVIVEAEERHYTKHTTLQQAISSILGIYMVTSGCPLMEMLKPMVRFHLPFSSEEETVYRVISMYLFAQYFLHSKDQEVDWKLEKLNKLYDEINIVNENFTLRLQSIKMEDANLNALFKLKVFADYVKFSIDANMITELEYLFRAYF